MKLINSKHITPFGGLNFVLEELQNLKLDKVLLNNLPDLPKQSVYDWKDIFYSFWSVFFVEVIALKICQGILNPVYPPCLI